MDPFCARVLIQIFATTNAIFLPLRRGWDTRTPSAVWCYRDQYHRRGVPWISGEHTEGGRKQAQRALSAMVADRLVKTLKSTNERTFAVRLTDWGSDYIASLCDGPTIWAALVDLQKLADNEDHPEAAAEYGWVPETALAGVRYDGTRKSNAALITQETMLLPALVRGWVESGSDMEGHVFYRVLPAGRSVLRDPPKRFDNLPAVDQALEAYYHNEALESAIAWIRSVESPVSNEIGILPLPCSIQRKGNRASGRKQAAAA